MKTVLIGGCGRSGTTMLGSMLGSSDSVIATPESDFIYRYYDNCLRESQKNNNKQISYGNFLADDWRFKQWKIDIPENLKKCFPKSLNVLGDCNIELVKIFNEKKGKKNCHIWVDHTPKNIMEYYLNLKIYTDLKFIHLVRDPRAIYLSIKDLDWGPSTALKTAKWWKDNIAAGLALESKYPEKILTIRYEDLLTNSQKVLQEICQFSSINYSEGMLRGGGLDLPDYTKEQHALVGKEIDESRAYSWKNEINRRDAHLIETSTRSILNAFNYEYTTDYTTYLSRKDKIRDNLIGILKLLPNSFKKRRREKNERNTPT